MSLSAAQRLSHIRQSFIREMTRLAMQHQAINLSQGFPDFDPPPEVLAAAHRALDEGLNQYTITWGLPALRQAIAEKMKRLYGLEFDPQEHITVTCGVTEAILVTLMGLLDAGDEVIVIEPFHEGYVPAVLLAGGRPRFVTLRPPHYALEAEQVRAAITARTRAILINTPHNPTGRVFHREELEGVARLCLEFDLVAITDEIYEHIVYDGRRHIPLATLEGMAERTVTLSGFGKTFAMTGWRLGYACAPTPLSEALRTVHDYTTVCAPTPLQAACVAALQLPDSYYQRLQEEYAQRRELILTILEEIGLSALRPQGAYYVMADFSRRDFAGDDHAFVRALAAERGVAAVPGSSFYATPGLGRKSVRFAFAKKMETLQAVRERLKQK